jgi:uncharacterized protein (TIGR00369 family)
MQDRKEPLLLFDMDGTLINQKDTPSYSGTKTHHSSYMSIKRQMKEIVIQHGVPKEKVVHLDRMALIWNQTRRILEERGKEENEIISLIEKINVPFMVEERADHSKSVLLPETIPTLKELTQNGMVHGGVLASMLDSACACAALSLIYPHGYITTIDLQVAYLKPVAKGTLTAKAECIRNGKNISFSEAKIYNERGEIICTGSSQLLKVELNPK